MEVTGWGGRRSERQMMAKKERRRMWRKKVRTREKEAGRDSRGMVWSKSEAEMVNETEEATSDTPLCSQMCKWPPQMSHLACQFQPLSGCTLVLAAWSLCDVSAPQSGLFSVPVLFCACSWSAGPYTAETPHSQW